MYCFNGDAYWFWIKWKIIAKEANLDLGNSKLHDTMCIKLVIKNLIVRSY